MRKSLLFGIGLLALGAVQGNAAEPLIIPEFYSMKISPDGQWILSDTGVEITFLYNLQTGIEGVKQYEGMRMGNGNVITNDGTTVGATIGDIAMVVKDGEAFTPASLASIPFCSLNGITADGKTICGLATNPKVVNPDPTDESNSMYVPIYVELGADGEYGEPIYLPYPEKDFLGRTPQYVSAVWISDDASVILGQVIDYSGMYIYPIVFRKNAGEWSYSLPTESLFNPEGIELPEDPGEFTLTPPEYTDYMDPDKKAWFEEDVADWQAAGYPQESSPYNNLETYMTEEQIEAYNKATEEYNALAQEFNEKIMAFYEVFQQILDTSVGFLQNGFTMNAAGTTASLASCYYVQDPMAWMLILQTNVYMLDITTDTLTKVESEYKDLSPGQVLADGCVLASTPAQGALPPTSYVLTPGASDFIPLEEYMAMTNPATAEWMQQNLVQSIPVAIDENGSVVYDDVLISGHAMASDDFSIVASGLMAFYFPVDSEIGQNTYASYVLTDLKNLAGVEGVAASNSAVKVMRGGIISVNGEVSGLTVADLSGRNVFRMESASGVVNTGLNRGIYIISYTDADGVRMSRKVTF